MDDLPEQQGARTDRLYPFQLVILVVWLVLAWLRYQ